VNERLVILGAGESGVGSAILGIAKGFDVFVSDLGMLKDEYRQEMISRSISFEEGQHTEALILNADLVIKSPGIPKSPIIKK
jgi:UDP-N-acetylmuramoylalanine--D-glutamate ligase